jgi:hypothetical protein
MGRGGAIIGREIGKVAGINPEASAMLGGAFLKFETGGAVKKNTKALLHKGEYVLPKGVKPTKAQRKAVNKGKKGKTGGKMYFV